MMSTGNVVYGSDCENLALLAAGANPSGVKYSGNCTIKQYLERNLQPHSHYPKIKVYTDAKTKPIYDKLVELGVQ